MSYTSNLNGVKGTDSMGHGEGLPSVWHLVVIAITQGEQGVEKWCSPPTEPPGAAPSHLGEEALLPC